MTAPEIDSILERYEHNMAVTENDTEQKLMNIWNKIQEIEIQGDDELRSIWIYSERGTIEDFGDLKEYIDEEIVNTEQEFKELWLSYYPQTIKWYKFSVNKYQNELFFYFDSRLVFKINGVYENEYSNQVDTSFLHWLETRVDNTILDFKKNSKKYNDYISNNLPYQRRYGRIVRKDYWSIFPQWEKDFKSMQTDDNLRIFRDLCKNSANSNNRKYLKTLTSGDFFRFCEIGYLANNYFDAKTLQLSAKEKYLKMADGRDCGLRKIDENSNKAFGSWYDKDSHCGGHPWEICRGGNSTHISLYVQKNEQTWYLRLAGSSRVRVVETLKISIALYKAKIPFILQDAEAILDMVCGNDFIGIVPENIMPVYCHGDFPKEDKIIDFMNLGIEKREKIIAKSYWYPLKKVEIINAK